MNKKKIKLAFTTMITISIVVGGYFLYEHLSKSVSTTNEMKFTDIVPLTNFEVQDTSGEMVAVEDLNDGKPIVINFWSYKCSPCVQEMPTFQVLYEEYKDDVHFVMINTLSDINATQTYVNDYQYTFPVYHDVKKEARRALYVPSLPTTYIVDQNFNVVRGGKGVVTYPMVKEVLDELLN